MRIEQPIVQRPALIDRKFDICFFSIVIPAYNAEATLSLCLKSIMNSRFRDFEVIVVDDSSQDETAAVAGKFAVTLIKLEQHQGPSWARNAGAREARGQYLLFLDADCLLDRDLLEKTYHRVHPSRLPLLGGTYAPQSVDGGFVSEFQALFVHYFETKLREADHLSGHLMIIRKDIFLAVGGFREGVRLGRQACYEDVELSLRLKKQGYDLSMDPQLQVKHLFGLNGKKALIRIFRRSLNWTFFATLNGTLARDAGTASLELKATALLGVLAWISLMISIGIPPFLIFFLCTGVGMSYLNRKFFRFIQEEKGLIFLLPASLYYLGPFCLVAAAGGLCGLLQALWFSRLGRQDVDL